MGGAGAGMWMWSNHCPWSAEKRQAATLIRGLPSIEAAGWLIIAVSGRLSLRGGWRSAASPARMAYCEGASGSRL